MLRRTIKSSISETNGSTELKFSFFLFSKSSISALPHSPTLASLHLRHSSFSNPSAALSTSELVLQSFRFFTYVIDTSPTSQLILQPFRRFIYVTAHSTTLTLFHLRPRHFTYVIWRAAHDPVMMFNIVHDSVICNDCGPQDYMKDVNWPSDSKG